MERDYQTSIERLIENYLRKSLHLRNFSNYALNRLVKTHSLKMAQKGKLSKPSSAKIKLTFMSSAEYSSGGSVINLIMNVLLACMRLYCRERPLFLRVKHISAITVLMVKSGTKSGSRILNTERNIAKEVVKRIIADPEEKSKALDRRYSRMAVGCATKGKKTYVTILYYG